MKNLFLSYGSNSPNSSEFLNYKVSDSQGLVQDLKLLESPAKQTKDVFNPLYMPTAYQRREDDISSAGNPDYSIIDSQDISTPTPKYSKQQWIQKMRDAYKAAGLTNETAIDNLIRQDALESRWGNSAQGKYNYGNITTGSKNYSGSYVTGDDTDGKGNPIKQKFRNYNSIDDYVKDKIALLKRRYDFDESDTTELFLAKLNGNNSSKYRYAEKQYGKSFQDIRLNRVGGILQKLSSGGTPKYMEDTRYVNEYKNRLDDLQIDYNESLLTKLVEQSVGDQVKIIPYIKSKSLVKRKY